MKHANVAIFVPHVGCPNKCSFCNQNSISGATKTPTSQEVEETCAKALCDLKGNLENSQIAFFGGSFTAINKKIMVSLLESAHKFIGEGKFSSIRLSTRPDAIDKEILDILKYYGVGSIELGVQSMNQEVLDLNHRGHSTDDVYESAKLIKEYGFELGLQMMVGLYGDTKEKVMYTAQKIAEIGCSTVRIYPTIVIKHTLLEKLYNEGKYIALTVDEASDICSELLSFFMKKNINVIRLGLHASELLEKDMLGGPYHPAFREICEGKIFYKKALNLLINQENKEEIIYVNNKSVSKMIGQNKCNIDKLYKNGYKVKIKGTDKVEGFDVVLGKDVRQCD